MGQSDWTSKLVEGACPLCNGYSHQVVSHQMQHGLDLNTVICTSCGFVFSNPLPEKSIYESFYTDAYAGYYGNITLRSSGNIRSLIPEFMRQKLQWISDVRKFSGTRLLEVGPGQGLFLWCAQQMGAEVVGIEPARAFFEVLQKDNLPCVFGALEQFNSAALGHFDSIVMSHVLEHFYDPNAALEQVRELLTDDGLLVVEVPNILKPFRSLDRYFLRYVHPSNFSRHTLDLFLQKHGFEPVFVNEGGAEWRSPQSLFVIAQKKKQNNKPPISPENWKNVLLRLRKYQSSWRYFGQYRWIFFELYLKARRFFFRSGRPIKRFLFRS
jgi:2-polyprenyl-3-methyl-5-hydroxy-6-metoxy-1,4-benzoquinol methylase